MQGIRINSNFKNIKKNEYPPNNCVYAPGHHLFTKFINIVPVSIADEESTKELMAKLLRRLAKRPRGKKEE